ncbi:uncharacterized protein LOC108327178 [Vigna angularis]|uniref:uncharacterized protein LOC108327178 n=1 Tax=Phaseolus angularis TaxID=3914 RepID=UPI0022B5DD41|nr:uncharacterized protein LOC108327178 [Vigna angularis]
MCLEGYKEGFLGSCRPFIGVDGCHLKTSYGGQLLVAVGRDPNDQYFPLAFAVVEIECKDTWMWFLTQLLDDIGGIDCQRWIFIVDQQKGLMLVVDDILNGVEHKLCLRHLYNNYKKKFGGGLLIRDLMMGAAKATYYKEWEKKMGELKNLNVDAFNWLMGIPTKSWCKHAFSAYLRCDVLINNLSESFNSTILLARDKPIISMMEWIRSYIMSRTCYAPIISPINGQQLWPTSDSPQLLPPIYKTPPGRPKKLRRREADEYVSHGKLSKTNIAIRCSSCNAYEHNVRTCKKSQKSKDKRGASTSTPGSASRRAASTGRGAASIAGRGASASASQAGRRSARDAGAGAASTSEVEGSATMREGGTRASSRVAGQILGSQASCN